MISVRVRSKPSFSHLQPLFHASNPFKNASSRPICSARIKNRASKHLKSPANQIPPQPRVSRRPAAADADTSSSHLLLHPRLSPTTTTLRQRSTLPAHRPVPSDSVPPTTLARSTRAYTFNMAYPGQGYHSSHPPPQQGYGYQQQ